MVVVALLLLSSVKSERMLRSPPLEPLNGNRIVLIVPRGWHVVPDPNADWRTWQYYVTLFWTGRLKPGGLREKIHLAFWVTPQSRAQRNGFGVGKPVSSRQGLRGVYSISRNGETGLIEENFSAQSGTYRYKNPRPGKAMMVIVITVAHRKGARSHFRELLDGFRIEPVKLRASK